MATGALLRSWAAPTGEFGAVARGRSDSWEYTEMTLRWSPNGQQLAFTWNATTIRSIAVTAPNGSLLVSSPTLAGLGTGYTPEGSSVTCFTPLPELPASMPTRPGVLVGTDAW
jgi:hypothetical protein